MNTKRVRGSIENIACDVPLDLRYADETLYRYGRWAMHRHKKQRCASAEGMYRIPPNDDDRLPRELLLTTHDALRAQRALAAVAERERTVLVILYVPQRLPSSALLRIKRIPPVLSRERHLHGLRMFDNCYRNAIAY